jgi:hypothetical protein
MHYALPDLPPVCWGLGSRVVCGAGGGACATHTMHFKRGHVSAPLRMFAVCSKLLPAMPPTAIVAFALRLISRQHIAFYWNQWPVF